MPEPPYLLARWCLTVSPSTWDQVPSLMTNIDALYLQRHQASKMSTVAFYVLMPYGCSGLLKSFSSCTLRSNANTVGTRWSASFSVPVMLD